MKHQEIADSVRTALHEGSGVPRDHGRDIETFYAKTVPALAERGLFGLLIPKEYGGRGLSVTEYIAAMESIGAYDLMAAYTINEHSTIGSLPLISHGTEEQKRYWLPRLAEGSVLAAFCLTEPKSGSDVTSLATKAEPVSGGYRINGKKIHISLAHHAGLFTVLTELADTGGAQRKTAFLMSRETEGLSNGPENSSPPGYLIPVAGSVVLENVVRTDDDVLGKIGEGGRIFQLALETARVGLTAALVGAGAQALDDCVYRLSNRQSFGQPLTSHQMVQSKLSDMAMRVTSSRLMVAEAAEVIDTDPAEATGICAMAKLYATEAMREVGADAIQLFGGAAFLEEPPVDWLMRDAKMAEILGGTSEVMRMLIAKSLVAQVPRTGGSS